MNYIPKEVIDMVIEDDLMLYIIDDTQTLISTFESKILNKEYEVFQKFDKLMERVKNVIELSFRCAGNPERTITSEVALLLVDLTELKVTMQNCDYKFAKLGDFFEEPIIIEDLMELIYRTAMGQIVERETYFTVHDIEVYKNKMLRLNGSEKSCKQKYQLAKTEKEIMEIWRTQHLNKDFDKSVLSEQDYEILKKAYDETEPKTISISWVQRAYNMGYARAGAIIDRLEASGAISSYRDMEGLGLLTSKRIIIVSLD